VETHSASKKQQITRRLLFFAFFLFPFALRLPGLTWGLPNAEHWYSYHPDERQIAFAVANVADNGNPQFFNYPSLFIFLTYGVYLLQSAFGLTTPADGNAPWPILRDIMLCGRLVSAILGALTVPAVYLLARRLTSEKFALFAAFLMAVAPGHVQHSHFATVDVPATFFVAWSLYFAICAMKPSPNPSRREGRIADAEVTPLPPGGVGGGQKALLLSALLAGLAGATKYNAGLVVIAPLLVAVQSSGARKAGGFKVQSSTAVIFLCALGFFIGCPHSLLDSQTFLGDRTNQGFLYELLVHPRQGHGDVFVNTGNGWLYHLTFNLPFAFTAPATVCALIGCVVAARSKNKVWIPLLAFAALYFLALGTSQVRFMRYLFPLFPVLCLAAPLCFQLVPRAAQKFGAASLALLMFIGATNVLYPFCVPDPRDQAAAYLKKVVTKPVTVALINQPWFYTPPLWPQDFPPPQKAQSGVSPDGRFRFEVVGFDKKKLELIKPAFLIFSEFEHREKRRLVNAEAEAFYINLKNRGILLYRKRDFFQLPGRWFEPHDFIYANPKVFIWSP
jgi:hypothetical protein